MGLVVFVVFLDGEGIIGIENGFVVLVTEFVIKDYPVFPFVTVPATTFKLFPVVLVV